MYAQRLTRIAVLALLPAVAGCDIAVDGHGGFDFGMAAGKAADSWSRSYPVTSGARLEIININGRITAEASDGSAIELVAARSAKAVSDEAAKELLDKLEMREEASDSRVRIEVRAPRTNGAGGHEITWTIKVPRGVSVDLRTVNGGVRMARLDSDVRARSTNGGIVGEALAASSVDAAVTNGGVQIELAKAVSAGTFDLEAVNGGVSISLPPDSKVDVEGRTVNGGISSSGLELEMVGEQSKRRLTGRLNGGGARVSLETVNGGLKVGRAGVIGND